MRGNALKLLAPALIAALLGTTAAIAAPATAPGVVASNALLAPVPALVDGRGRDKGVLLAEAAPTGIGPYLWSATKAADGTINLAGEVPSQDVRTTLLDGISQLGTDSTVLASGEPDGFAVDAVAGLDVLSNLTSGVVSYDGASWHVSGTVDSDDQAATALAAFNASPLKALNATYSVNVATAARSTSAPAADNSTAASATAAAPAKPAAATPTPAPATASAAPAAAAPAAAPATSTATSTPATTTPAPATTTPAPTAASYAWAAVKTPDGHIAFSGDVPTPALKGFLVTHAQGDTVDTSTVVKGAPAGFVGGALYGLDALMALQSGKLSFADGKWSLAGTASPATAKSALATLGGVVDTKDWQFDITAPAPAVAEAPPAAVPAPTTAAPAATTAAPAKPAATSAAPAAPYTFWASKSAGASILLGGDVPTAGAKGYFGTTAGDVPTGGLSVVPGAPPDFIINALAGLDALAMLGDGSLEFDGTHWSLKGHAKTPDIVKSVTGRIAALPAGKRWTTDIVGPTESEICTGKLAEFAASNSVNFDHGTHLAPGSDAELDTLAADLAQCPSTPIDVAGNTDSDGDASSNMALSVARAETVVAALVKRGVKADRLYAIGYGETLPLVPNTTSANKAKNRRIEFSVHTGK